MRTEPHNVGGVASHTNLVHASVPPTKQLNHSMNSNNGVSREQALVLSNQPHIRFAEDTPVAIPCLQNAVTICLKYFNDPYVLQALIFFLGSLLTPQPLHLPSGEQQILRRWEVCSNDLLNPYRPVYRDDNTCGKVHAIIDQLHPLATYQELQATAAMFLRGDPRSTDRRIRPNYTMVDRGHDWIVRCAIECATPEHAKIWLQLIYEKQPNKVIDIPSHIMEAANLTFMEFMWNAARLNGFGAMIPVIKFYLRQAMIIADIWEVWVSADVGLLAARSCMPEYSWCVAAYKQLWYQFKKDLQDPFSEYPYQVRDQLKQLSYMRVFEECWQWVHFEAGDIHANDFNGHNVREQLHDKVLTKVRDEFQPRITEIAEILDEAFGSHSILTENRVIDLLNDPGYPYLDEVRVLADGLCRGFYRHLPEMSQQQYEARYPDSESEIDSEDGSDMDINDEEYELEDVEVEAYGARLNVADFTLDKQPVADDICTICQIEISLGNTDGQRCVGPAGCLDVFHAECLGDWVNGASKTSNLCPNCQTEITTQRRPRRAKQ